MARLSVSLLGSFEVTYDGEPVTAFESNKIRALLAYLIVESDRPHSREQLAGLLWPERNERSARANLRSSLNRLRTTIHDREAEQPFLSINREAIQFVPESDHWLDVSAFTQAIQATQGHSHLDMDACVLCAQRLQEAADLYRGDLLAGFSLDSAPFEEWLVFRREALHRQALDALYHLAAYHQGLGDYELVIQAAQRQVELEPWSERAHRQWMRALALGGERAAALRQYEQCVQILQEELGASPGAETIQLYQAIQEQRVAPPAASSRVDRESVLARQALSQPTLPQQATSFVGRETQLAEIRALLAQPDVRLLTLTGVGGTGKTRLALQAASGLRPASYPDGVFFVPLATLRDPALVVPTIAAALGVRASGDTPLIDALKYALRDRERLLVLDNFEQVVQAAPSVNELLSAAPGLQVMVTSRAPLHVSGEHEYAVPPMETPQREATSPQGLISLESLEEVDAVSLFVQGARRVLSTFVLDEENAPAVAEICVRLDGLPLAIELAAARIKHLSPQALLTHLERASSVQFLTGGPRDVPARQRTLRATMDWSYDLLDADELGIFAQLSVFAGGATLQAIETVCADHVSFDLVESLIDQSLLQASRTTPPRFTMLETVREYAWQRLQESCESDWVRDRHAAYYANALQNWAADLKGPRQVEALVEIEADLDNARAAWEWAVDSARGRTLVHAQVEWMDRAIEGLCLFYEWHGRYQEGKAACQKAIDRLQAIAPSVPSGASSALVGLSLAETQLGQRVLARALAWQARFGRLLGQYEGADRSLERALSLLDHPELSGQEAEQAFVLLCMAERAADTDYDRAMQLGERSLTLYQALGDRWGMAKAFMALGSVAWNMGDPDRRRQSYEQSLALHRALGDRRGIALSLTRLGLVADNMGQLEEGERLAREAMAIARQLDDDGLVRGALMVLSTALHDSGRFAEAMAAREEILAICRERGTLAGERELLTGATGAMLNIGVSARHRGWYDQTRAMVQAALPTLRAAQHRTGMVFCQLELGRLALAAGAHDEAERELLKVLEILDGVAGHFLLPEGLATLAYAALGKGECTRAEEYLRLALQRMMENGHLNAALQAMPAMALLLVDKGGHSAPTVEQAVELYALVSRSPYVANSRWFEDVAGKQIEALAATLLPEEVAAAQERGRTRDLESTMRELLNELEDSSA